MQKCGIRLYSIEDIVAMKLSAIADDAAVCVLFYGYVSFSYDLTPYIKWDRVIAYVWSNGETT